MLLLAYVLATQPPKYLPQWLVDICEITGLVLLAAAAFGRVWCLIFIAGRKNASLVTAGPYSAVRNPLYAFSFLGAVGFGLSVENPLLAVLLAVIFGAYYSVIVKKEEQYLATSFGAAYQEFAARTPRWLPDFSLYQEPETVLVVTARIRSGLLDAVWFIWAYVLWEVVEIVRSAVH